MDAKAGLANWEKANNVSVLSADEVYRFDPEKYKDSLKGDPWKKEYAIPGFYRPLPSIFCFILVHQSLLYTDILLLVLTTSRRSEFRRLHC